MKKLFILSGAGLSAESGIQTFSGSDGLWAHHRIEEICSTEGWARHREKTIAFYNERRAELASREPNGAHRLLARLEERHPDRIWNLTQNVDDLLERAGCARVIHLHGILTRLRCEGCSVRFPVGYAPQEPGTVCPACGCSRVRPDVVFFGESAPNYRFLYKALRESGLFVALGTSGRVIDLPDLARSSARSLYVNPDRERYVTHFGDHEKRIDEYFSETIFQPATEAVEELEMRIEAFFRG